jgi:hypothetical protein
MKRSGAILGLVVLTFAVTACTGVSFSKAGESDAQAACDALRSIQGSDVTAEEGLIGLTDADIYSRKAADQNDDYTLLHSAMKALNDSIVTGSEDLAQSAWANAARLCNDL